MAACTFFVLGAFSFTTCSGSDDGLTIPSYFSYQDYYSTKTLTVFIYTESYGEVDEDGNLPIPSRTYPGMPQHLIINNEYRVIKINENFVYDEIFTVTTIGSFIGLTNLKSIQIPASVTKINDYAFSNCANLKSVSFEESSQLKTIGQEAFKNCTKLSVIDIPVGAFVGNRAFEGWTSAQTIRVHFASQAEADAAWGTGWRQSTYANIVYLSA